MAHDAVPEERGVGVLQLARWLFSYIFIVKSNKEQNVLFSQSDRLLSAHFEIKKNALDLIRFNFGFVCEP